MQNYIELATRCGFNIQNTEFMQDFLEFAEKTTRKSKVIQDFLRTRTIEHKLPVSRFSRKYWLLRGYSEDSITDKIKIIQGSHTSSVAITERLLKAGKSIEEIASIIYDKRQKHSKSIIEMHKKYAAKDPLYYNKMSRFFKEFWIRKGYSEEQAIELAANSSANNRKIFREKLDNNEIKKGWNTTTIDYYLKKGMCIEEAQVALFERQRTFTLEKCKARYGEIEGLLIWQNRQDKWKKSVFNAFRWIGGGKSKIASELFKILNENDALFGKDEKYIRNNGIVFKYDFCIKEKKKIIEFNGDYWHCNPKFYTSEFFHKNKMMLSKDIWEFDKIKEEAARSKGYDYLVIWESEYKQDPEHTINKCKQFLNTINDTIDN